jgi:glycosyltransferase involved in cell wall biosynthesis
MHQLDVLIPHYNDPAGLALSLASVRGQEWTGTVRAVIYDDGSTPTSYGQALAVAQESGVDCLLLRNTTNRGRPYARNALLDAAESPLVAWLDAGDEWYPQKTSLQVDALLRARHATGTFLGHLVTSNYHWCNGEGRRSPRRQAVSQDQFKALLIGNTLRAYLWTLLGTRETFLQVGRFDERLSRLQDLDYCLRFVSIGGKLHMPRRKDPLCAYHKSDIGRDASEIRRCNDLIQRKHAIAIASYGRHFMRTRRYGAEMLSARFAFNNGDKGRMLRYMARAGLARPKMLIAHLATRGLSP